MCKRIEDPDILFIGNLMTGGTAVVINICYEDWRETCQQQGWSTGPSIHYDNVMVAADVEGLIMSTMEGGKSEAVFVSCVVL